MKTFDVVVTRFWELYEYHAETEECRRLAMWLYLHCLPGHSPGNLSLERQFFGRVAGLDV